MDEGPLEKPNPGRRMVLVYRGIGMVCVGLASVGFVLPLMPTTVFLLIALWAFARGSPEWAERVRTNPRFGPMVRDWEERGAIPLRAKALAVGMMATSLAILWLGSRNLIVTLVVGGVLAGVSGYILTRPSS